MEASPRTRERLLTALRERVTRFHGGDPAAVAAPEALDEVAELIRAHLLPAPAGGVPDAGEPDASEPGSPLLADLEALHLVSWLRVCRAAAAAAPVPAGPGSGGPSGPDGPHDLRDTLVLLRAALRRTSDRPWRVRLLTVLFDALGLEIHRTGEPGLMDEAVEIGRAAMAAMTWPEGEAPPPETWVVPWRVAALLHQRFHRTGVLADLDEGLRYCVAACSAVPEGHPLRPAVPADLAAMFYNRFEVSGQLTDLDQAIGLARQAVAGLAAGHPVYAQTTCYLAMALRARFAASNRAADLDDAVAASRAAVAATVPGQRVFALARANLAQCLHARFTFGTSRADLNEAVALLDEARAALEPGDPYAGTVFTALSTVLYLRHVLDGEAADLDGAVEAARRAVAIVPPRHQDRANTLAALGRACLLRFVRSRGDGTDPRPGPAEADQAAADLAEAERVSREALASCDENHPQRDALLIGLCEVLIIAFLYAEHAAATEHGLTPFLAPETEAIIDEAVRLARQAVSENASSRPYGAAMWLLLARTLMTRHERGRDPDDLEEAEQALREALLAAPEGHRSRAAVLETAARVRETRIALGSAAARPASERPPGGFEDDDDAREHLVRGLDTGDAAGVEQAMAYFRRIADTAGGGVGDAAGLDRLGTALFVRASRTGRPADLDEMVRVAGAAVAATPPGDPERPGRLANLTSVLLVRHQRLGARADLDAAVRAAEDALGVPLPAANDGGDHRDGRTSPGRTDDGESQAFRWNVLSGALLARFELDGDRADIDGAVLAARRAVELTPGNRGVRARFLQGLAIALRRRRAVTGDDADLDEAARTAHDAVVAVPAEHDHAPYLSLLAELLTTRYTETTHAAADLDQAVSAARAAVTDSTRTGGADRPRYLFYLARVLLVRAENTGTLADLDEALTMADAGIAATPEDDADRAERLRELARPYRARYHALGRPDDLAAMLAVLQAGIDTALGAGPGGDACLARLRGDLAVGLRDRFELFGDEADLDTAVAAARQALAGTLDPADRAGTLVNLGLLLDARFRGSRDAAELDEAVRAAQEAERLLPTGHEHAGAVATNLAVVLTTRFEATGDAADRDHATDAARRAVRLFAETDPRRSAALTNLAALLQWSSTRPTSPDDRAEALAALRAAAESPAASVTERLAAAGTWGHLAGAAGDADQAATAYELAVRLLPMVAWRGFDRATREARLAEASTLTRDAAAWAIEAGRPERALELLEQGRGVLWAQRLETRADLDELRRAEPALAARLEDVRHRLDHPASAAGDATADAGAASRQRRFAQEWDALLARARSVPGFAGFLRPTAAGDLLRAADQGPVVIVNTSAHRCDALVVTGDGVRVVPLPDLDHATAAARAEELLRTLWRLQTDDGPEPAERPDNAVPVPGVPEASTSGADASAAADAYLAGQRALAEILAWLWDSTAGPVLAALGHDRTPAAGAAWPRLWWCPTGPLTFMPLHAAGRHPGTVFGGVASDGTASDGMASDGMASDGVPPEPTAGPRSVLDLVVSSYTPTLAALLRARARPTSGGAVRLLGVGVPDAPGQEPLPGVTAELSAVSRQVPVSTGLYGAAATRDEVAAALARHSWAHVACHGGQDLDDPSSGSLLLYDGPLTVLRIADLSLRQAEFAFLSGCWTATGGMALSDEAVNLAAAFQVAGYRHVIATLWRISDELGAELADHLYRGLAGGTGNAPGVVAPDASRAAEALHGAVRALRAAYPDYLDLWTPYIHTGP